jgi:hypothetical protein
MGYCHIFSESLEISFMLLKILKLNKSIELSLVFWENSDNAQLQDLNLFH